MDLYIVFYEVSTESMATLENMNKIQLSTLLRSSSSDGAPENGWIGKEVYST